MKNGILPYITHKIQEIEIFRTRMEKYILTVDRSTSIELDFERERWKGLLVVSQVVQRTLN